MKPHDGIDQAASGVDGLALNFRHAFDIRLFFENRWDFKKMPAGGSQHYTSLGKDGTVMGPLLNGRVVDHSGADWPVRREDGVVEINAHYVIEADDGTLIYLRNLGYVHGHLKDKDGDTPPYFRCTPYFRCSTGPHDWLNRKVLIGLGSRRPKTSSDDLPDHSIFRYFLIL